MKIIASNDELAGKLSRSLVFSRLLASESSLFETLLCIVADSLSLCQASHANETRPICSQSRALSRADELWADQRARARTIDGRKTSICLCAPGAPVKRLAECGRARLPPR